MTYLPVNELKQGKRLWERLHAEKQLVVTRDGRPCAVLIGVEPDTVEDSVGAIRRALFSAAVSRVRRRAAERPPAPDLVARAIAQGRRRRPAA
jgi:antitoxin (DNA-binding transcriptional repressor) of toxin-antitoxin stability system